MPKVQLKFTYPSGAAEREICFVPTSAQWAQLHSRFRVEPDVVDLGSQHFHSDMAVEDETCLHYHPDAEPCMDAPCTERGAGTRPPELGGIVVLLESRHFHEYEYRDGRLKPSGPLRNPQSWNKFCTNVERIIREAAELRGVQVAGPVTLCNPIPFQASLHHCLSDPVNTILQRAIRTAVWSQLYYYKDDQGARLFEDDFVERVGRYEPVMIINACTKALRHHVSDTLRRRIPDVAAVEASEHPADWGPSTKVTRLGNKRALGPRLPKCGD